VAHKRQSNLARDDTPRLALMRRVYAASVVRLTALVSIAAPPAFSSAPPAASMPLTVDMATSALSVVATASVSAIAAIFAAGLYVARTEARFRDKARSIESKLSKEATAL
jgi:hypothetical protein